MTTINTTQKIDMAALPLGDGRHIMLPLMALAEVQRLRPELGERAEGFGTLQWRGKELAIGSLDEFCGLPPQARERHTTVGVFRGSADEPEPFRALAFCGLATHMSLGPEQVISLEPPAEGHFAAAAEIDGAVYLVPDIEGLWYSKENLH